MIQKNLLMHRQEIQIDGKDILVLFLLKWNEKGETSGFSSPMEVLSQAHICMMVQINKEERRDIQASQLPLLFPFSFIYLFFVLQILLKWWGQEGTLRHDVISPKSPQNNKVQILICRQSKCKEGTSSVARNMPNVACPLDQIT